MIDLHVHTTASDGATLPQDAVEEAVQLGLKVISFTDHESIEGYLEARALAEAKGIKLIPGVELLTAYADQEIHLLGYFFDPESPLLQKRLNELREQRNEVAMEIVENLRQHGFNIRYERVIDLAHGGAAYGQVAIGKNHILHAIYDAGYIQTQDEAVQILRKYLTRNSLAYVEFKKHPLGEAVELVRESGGIPILAHPGLIHNDELVKEIIRRFQLPGIEVYYYYFGDQAALIEKYRVLAEEWNLLITGGSDYHGRFAPVPMGQPPVPFYIVEQLEEFAFRNCS